MFRPMSLDALQTLAHEFRPAEGSNLPDVLAGHPDLPADAFYLDTRNATYLLFRSEFDEMAHVECFDIEGRVWSFDPFISPPEWVVYA